jgi:RHS repeat-associated protein
LIEKKWLSDNSLEEVYEWNSQPITDLDWTENFFGYYPINIGRIASPLKKKVTTITKGDASYYEEFIYERASPLKYGLPTKIRKSSEIYDNGTTEYIRYFFEDNSTYEDKYLISFLLKKEIYKTNGGKLKEFKYDYYEENGKWGAIKSINKLKSEGNYLTWNYGYLSSNPNYITITVDLPGTGGTETMIYRYGVLATLTHPGYTEFTRTISAHDSSILSETNQHGAVMGFTYDDLGRITATTMPSGFNSISTSWSSDSVSSTQGGNKIIKYWDGMGRDTGYVEQGDGINLYFRKSLDSEGRIVAESKGSTNSANTYGYLYNAAGQITKITDPMLKETNISMDANHKTVIDANQHTTYFEYNHLPGLVTKLIDPADKKAEFTFDGVGRLLSTSYNYYRTQSYSYNGLDQVTSENHPETGEIKYAYSTANNLETKTWGGTSTTYTYNPSNQVLTEDDGDEKLSYTYDSNGRISSINSSLGWTKASIGYNSFGNVTQETITIPELSAKTVYYAYDGNNQLKKITYPDGSTSDYANNGLNMPETIAFNGSTLVNAITYGIGKHPTLINISANGTSYAAAYNSNGSLTTAQLKKSSAFLYDADYTYDGVGNITALNNSTPTLNASYNYDARNRLSGASYTPSGVGQVNNFVYVYNYDDYGNMTQAIENASTVFSQSYTNQNQVSGYTYDSRGNLTSTSLYNYAWDNRNRLSKITSKLSGEAEGAFAYDEKGMRLKAVRALTSELTITAPNGGESWIQGSTQTITWTSLNCSGNVSIELYQTANKVLDIATVDAAAGTYSWTIPIAQLVAADYRIRISQGSIKDFSDAVFSIADAPRIIITTPNDGEVWTAGNKYNITWTAINILGNVKIELYQNNVKSRDIVDGIDVQARTYSWDIPKDLLAGTNYKIKIIKDTIEDFSDANFTIAAMPSLLLTAPTAVGITLRSGTQYSITWNHRPEITGNVAIDLYKAGSNFRRLADSVPVTDKTYLWRIPADITAGTDYKVRISQGSIEDLSENNFSIYFQNGSLGICDTTNARDVHVVGNLAYVADWDGGLRIINVANPAAPAVVGTFKSANATAYAKSVRVAGSYAYIAYGDDGLVVVNVSNPASPQLTGSYNTPGSSRSVQIVGNTAYIADEAGGLQIIDISNPAAPQLVGSFTNPGTTTIAKGIAVAGNYVYLAYNSDGLIIVDVTNPAVPTKVGAYTTPDLSNWVAVKDNYVYIADSNSGLLIINITNPANPSLTGSYDTSGYAAEVYVNGQYAYVADLTGGLQVINIANPASPTLAFNVPTAGNALGVYGKGGYAYVAAADAGLQIIQVTCPWIALSAPNGGENWQADTLHDITWHLNSATGNVNIELFKGDVWYQSIATVDSALEKFEWALPEDISAGNNYRIHLLLSNSGNLEDLSDNSFTIQAAGSSFAFLPGKSFSTAAAHDRMNQVTGGSMQHAGPRSDRSLKDDSIMQLTDDGNDQALSGPHAGVPAITTPVIVRAAVYSKTYYIHSFDGKLLAEYDATGTCQKDYIYMGNKLIAEYQPVTGAKYYYASDQINSTRIITNSSGTVVYSALFDPYGGMQKQWVNTYQPSLKFSGKERESKSEMDYFGARYYDHKRYRFISVDPVINKEEALVNPQLWNLYSYCRNNPATYLDPDGREDASVISDAYAHMLWIQRYGEEKASIMIKSDNNAHAIASAVGVGALALGAATELILASLPFAQKFGDKIQSAFNMSPELESLSKTAKVFEMFTKGTGETATKILESMAQTEAGRAELLKIHQTISGLISGAKSLDALSIMQTIQQITGTLSRGGK